MATAETEATAKGKEECHARRLTRKREASNPRRSNADSILAQQTHSRKSEKCVCANALSFLMTLRNRPDCTPTVALAVGFGIGPATSLYCAIAFCLATFFYGKAARHCEASPTIQN